MKLFDSLFSQRKGYSPADNAFVRERITIEIQNAICNCYDDFEDQLRNVHYNPIDVYQEMESFLWRYFLNEQMSEFSSGYNYKVVLKSVVQDNGIAWFKKLDVIEFSLRILFTISEKYTSYQEVIDKLVDSLNFEFKRLNYAYRIVDRQVVEITSEEEIAAINQALEENKDAVREHLKKALELCSKRPVGDYRNSIKESISAVEVICRKKTGEETLGKALNKLEKNGVIIPQMLKLAFDKLYAYTNNETTGIRHALMDDDGTYTPGSDEAIFMLVSCSAFINYLNKK